RTGSRGVDDPARRTAQARPGAGGHRRGGPVRWAGAVPGRGRRAAGGRTRGYRDGTRAPGRGARRRQEGGAGGRVGAGRTARGGGAAGWLTAVGPRQTVGVARRTVAAPRPGGPPYRPPG